MHKQTILIVDDVMLNRAVIRGVLKKQFSHVEFHEADDGIQAMNAIEKYDVDLVILDLLMPNKDGFEVLKALKADKQYEGIPIIVISSLQDIESIQKALELGAYEYFTKPFSSNQLEVILPQKVRNALTISRRSKFCLHRSSKKN